MTENFGLALWTLGCQKGKAQPGLNAFDGV